MPEYPESVFSSISAGSSAGGLATSEIEEERLKDMGADTSFLWDQFDDRKKASEQEIKDLEEQIKNQEEAIKQQMKDLGY